MGFLNLLRNRKKDKWVIFDLDGTLSDASRRAYLAKQHQWDQFHHMGKFDYPNKAERAILLAMRDCGYKIAICTGRSDRWKVDTENWLRYYGIEYDRLVMRSEGDHRSDTVVKLEMINNWPKNDIVCIFEDRTKVVQMWRDNGYRCFQNQEGDY